VVILLMILPLSLCQLIMLLQILAAVIFVKMLVAQLIFERYLPEAACS